MINITIIKTNHLITAINCQGHAQTEAGDETNNKVCAAVTGIITGGCNVLDRYRSDQVKITCEIGLAVIKLIQPIRDRDLTNILKTLYIQLLTINQQYTEYFKWKELT